ncbi:MAG: 50S ribosomal protein L6 [Alphaproteobacteria bacterium]|nr:50S ribosomal protein L6 [Alphaproteobacteria bacterium]MCY4499451.1 50S ribosomal protein L6 [Rhodospirillaceae bacterium]
MSRIGQRPVPVPQDVTVEVSGQEMTARGPMGELSMTLVEEVLASLEDDEIVIKPRDNSKRSRTMWGMQRTLVDNLVRGVSQGFSVELEIIGVGYRAAVEGRTLNLQMGYSHEINYPIPEDIDIKCERPTAVSISGMDRQKVGQVAAEIRAFRKPEPYKGKGIRYVGEYVFRKEGKKK